MPVLVTLVNYKVGDLTVECLRSLEPEIEALPGSRVVVVDNASGDGSFELIRRGVEENGWPWVEVVASPENGGFSRGHNLAYEKGTEDGFVPEYVLLLNPDMVARPRAIQILLEFLESHPEVGLAGSRSEDPDATPQLCCFRFPNLINEFAMYVRLGIVDRLFARRIARVPISDEAHPIDWVSGASMIIRQRVLDEVGGLDPGYFLYFEETDLALRARRAGWRCWYVPQSRVVHYVGRSTGVTRRESRPDRRPGYWYDSRRRYFLKNHGRIYALGADLAALSGLLLWKLRVLLQRKTDLDPPFIFRDLFRHSVICRGFSLR